jgi:DNA processing protein
LPLQTMTSQPDTQEDWLALHLISGLGNLTIKKLLERFGNPAGVLRAPMPELLAVEGIRKEVARKISKKEFAGDPAKVLRSLARWDARVITYGDPAYPDYLRQIHDPPMVLYLRGHDIPQKIPFLAIVGSRGPTPYGLRASENLGQGLARRGVGVVSGLARGIDAAAHWGCLGGHGFTVAVLGTGIDVVYPASNKKLFEEITKKGVVISEFPVGTPPEPRNFPIRNRIISGLSRGVIVVEATMHSGSLITASVALEQGREVFAVPGSIQSFKSRGCHYLIKQGARLVENSDDVLDELGMNFPFAPKTDTFKTPLSPPTDEWEQKVYELIGDYPIHIDEIAREGKIEPSVVSAALMRMELKGIVRQLPGKFFVR